MESSDVLVLVIMGVSFVGAIFCYLRLFAKPATFLLKGNYPLTHQPAKKKGHYAYQPESILTLKEQELLIG